MGQDKKTKKFERYQIIGIYEMVGGALGLFITGSLFKTLVIDAQDRYLSMIWLFFIAFIFYIVSLNAGYLLFRKNRRGVMLSIITQALQVPNLAIFGISYYFVSGLSFGVSLSFIETAKFDFNYYLGSTWNLGFGSTDGEFLIGINLVALMLLTHLIKINKQKTL